MIISGDHQAVMIKSTFVSGVHGDTLQSITPRHANYVTRDIVYMRAIQD